MMREKCTEKGRHSMPGNIRKNPAYTASKESGKEALLGGSVTDFLPLQREDAPGQKKIGKK